MKRTVYLREVEGEVGVQDGFRMLNLTGRKRYYLEVTEKEFVEASVLAMKNDRSDVVFVERILPPNEFKTI